MNIKRYDPRDDCIYGEMEERNDGDWLSRDEVLALIQKHIALRKNSVSTSKVIALKELLEALH